MNCNPKVLVGTLYSGENELPECIESLKNQTHTNWNHKIIRFLPNIEAHKTLYQTIMSSTDEYDLFVKLDADMVLIRPTILEEIISQFSSTSDMDHAVFSVRDWCSGTDIMGLHVYSGRVEWCDNSEGLFVDPSPEIKGVRKLFWDEPAPVAKHSPNPTLKQAYLFGLHRALKVVQRDRRIKKIDQARLQLELLHGVWAEFVHSRDIRRAAVLLGAEMAFSGNETNISDKSDVCCDKALDDLHAMGVDDALKNLESQWQASGFRARLRMFRWVVMARAFNRVRGFMPKVV